jgi:Rieske Fe-S protein
MTKRKQLVVGIVSLLLLGGALAAYPFIASLSPSASRERPFIDVDITDIKPGGYRVVEILGYPAVVVRPSPQMRAALVDNARLTFNKTVLNDAPVFVFRYYSPVHGCTLEHAPPGPRYSGEENWPGGFFDPCHYGAWDYAGRGLNLQEGAPQVPDLTSPSFAFKGDVVRIELLPIR